MHGTASSSVDPGQGARDGEARIERLFEMASDLLATISPDGRFTLLNPAWERLLGWSREELLARPMSAFLHPEDAEATSQVLRAQQHARAELQHFTSRLRHRDGSWRSLMWSTRREGEVWYAAARDVTDHMLLERQALHDPLTHLPNRLLLMDRARQALSRLGRTQGTIAMLFVDLDRFKAVNDTLGHDVGDQLLIATSARLAELMRDSDTVARLGGDEFVILAENIDSHEEALALAERVLDSLERPFALGAREIAMLASVGVAVSRDPDADPENMLREADVAMYRAKRAGGRRLQLFDESMRQELTARLEVERRLRDALPRQELILAYQPMMPLAGGTAIACEALVRWRPGMEQPDGEVLAGDFLPRAGDSELMVQIGGWVLSTACVEAAGWRRRGAPVPVSVNISPRELTELDLAERVRDALSYSRLPGHALCLEISEEAVLRDPERARAALDDLRRLGISIALDNFGSGDISLGLPGNLPLDLLKVDRALVHSFERDRDRRAMFAATIALAKAAGLTAVAVGIETARQLALARELECTVGQGFLLHNPASAQQLRLRDVPGAVTSAPWRPRVRLGSGVRI